MGPEGRQRRPQLPAGHGLRAKYTLFAEGCRGHLGKSSKPLQPARDGVDPQTYGIGIKELWEIPAAQHPGLIHTAGWLMDNHLRRRLLLSPRGQPGGGGLRGRPQLHQPHLSPFEEFQRYKTHPEIRKFLEGG